ncbi:MAG: transglutaminase family protein [Rudaea sp.]|uniref:transglutaminase family protein n=1 Tax=Rudaea sp. TaxID=2136325 RepID=UPI0039E70841
MSIHVALNHVTHYRYDRLVHLGPQVVRLRPAPHSRTRILSYSLGIEPAGHFINWQQDPLGNWLARLVFPEPTREFRVEVDLVAEMAVFNPFDFFLEPEAEKFPFAYDNTLRRELTTYLVKLPATARVENYVDAIRRDVLGPKPRRTADVLVEINRRLARDIRYLIRMEPGVQTPDRTLELGSGSCRDSGWLLVQVMRHLGFAARFVSGYLIQLTADQKAVDGPSGPEHDFTDLHAWCEVYLPGAGWIGLDPTSGLLAGEGHIPLACSPEPGSAAPISGAVDKSEVEFSHTMTVARISESPRVTKPYTPQQWSAIEALGQAVDANLERLDVRLTQGGEPTFVAADDPDGAEWNTAALGPTKRLRAAGLYHRLREKYAPHGLVHFGQGKWYPGEQLPRWSLNCFWRRDGEPIWSDPSLIADEKARGNANAELGAAFLAEVAGRLELDAGHVFPAYEDLFYYLWRERRLPDNVDPFDSRVSDPLERERLMRVFTQGLSHVVGHVFPLAKPLDRWQTGPWFLRTEHCYLVPGDSALGWRLPLDSQPWASENDYPWVHPADPAQAFKPLPRAAEIRRQMRGATAFDHHSGDSVFRRHPRESGNPATVALDQTGTKALDSRFRGNDDQEQGERKPAPFQSASWITRTALSAETRNGNLYLFMPPLARLEDYLELTAAIEDTAAALGTPVLLEGYEPPRDPRLNSFRVTPDPGVIEVNIHPSENWDQLVDRTTHLYEAARQEKLVAEKFMLDGRHTGTGGGNHFVLGGATTNDSPFLRRPDLLRSLLSYWHNHPSLSYLFSGLFIGPTSQSPRVDEARNDSLYELEVAFKQFPDLGGDVPPWLLDRLLRNLLIDVTGNTHRAEFCIDKLYSPDGTAGRLGLLEMRAFEMPPHAQMSLVQQLLLRALIARFWQTPYEPARLARWGTELHDRFMLPYFVERDFDDVIRETRESGYAIERDWFAPHFEFRFPAIGDYATQGIALELRHALEPWHVLGEEGATGGTVRYVDSSVERLQVKLSGLAPDRFVATCNGRSIPLRPTGAVGEFVAGVRYKAWQPPSALHPTIPAHPPLVFDLVDTWSLRSLGGCRYHVAHPGGRNYDTFPVNAFEAESRRLARFDRYGHTPGRVDAAAAVPNPDFPFTLDLRND